MFIFYNNLKKQAIASYEASLKELQTSFIAAQTAITRLNLTRKNAVDLLINIKNIINTISNTPKEINVNIQQVNANMASFQPIDELTQEAYSGYLNAACELIKGVGRGFAHIGSGDLISKRIDYFRIAFHIVSFLANLSKTNIEIYEKAKEQTKNVKTYNAHLQSYTVSIDCLADKAAAIYNPLNAQLCDLSHYRFCNYVGLSLEEKKFLGEIVNNSLALSYLLSTDDDYEEISDE